MWFRRQWPAAPPLDVDHWTYALSSHQIRHLRYACEVFASHPGGGAPTFAEFILATRMIGLDVDVAYTLVLGGPDAWREYLMAVTKPA